MVGCVTDVLENIEECQNTLSKVSEKMSKLTNEKPPSSSLVKTLKNQFVKIEKDLEVCSGCLHEQFFDDDSNSQPPPTPEASHYSDEYDWNRFKLITQKKGAHGPSKGDCLRYYKKK